MKDLQGRIAVVTGGGSGMGRELARQLSADGCHVSMCDVSAEGLEETRSMCEREAPAGTRISASVADVSSASAVEAFAASVATDHQTEHINLLFNNAGIGGGGSFVLDERSDGGPTFNLCLGGGYLCTRAFLPM